MQFFPVQMNFIEASAVLTAALCGIIEAHEKKMDIIGVFFVGFVTAFGGGTVRDLLLGRNIFWLTNELYPLSIFLLAIVFMTFLKHKRWNLSFIKWSILLLDAIALATFSIVGSQYAFERHCAFSVCIIMGIITGTFGGVIRDIICNQIPMVFGSSKQLYASCSFLGCTTYSILMFFSIHHYQAASIGIIVIFATRFLSLIYDWKLPSRLR